MEPSRTYRYTIRQFMAGTIVVLAGLLVLPLLATTPELLAMGLMVAFLTTSILCLLEYLSARRCPACSSLAMRRLRNHFHYFCCTTCRARFKRFGRGPWLDASGPDDAVRFARPTGVGAWKGFVPPQSLDGSTGGLLLQARRSRDLLVEVRRRPHLPGARRLREEAERKVRNFVRHLSEW